MTTTPYLVLTSPQTAISPDGESGQGLGDTGPTRGGEGVAVAGAGGRRKALFIA